MGVYTETGMCTMRILSPPRTAPHGPARPRTAPHGPTRPECSCAALACGDETLAAERPVTPNVAMIALRHGSRDASAGMDVGSPLSAAAASPGSRPRSPWSAGRIHRLSSSGAHTGAVDRKRLANASVVVECDLSGRIEYLSPTFATLFQYGAPLRAHPLRSAFLPLPSADRRFPMPALETALRPPSIPPSNVVGTLGNLWFDDVAMWQAALLELLNDPSNVLQVTLDVKDRAGQVRLCFPAFLPTLHASWHAL